MENSLRNLLAEDEKLLWTGRPEPFEVLDKTNKTSILTGLVIKVLVIVGCLLLYYTTREGGDSKPIVPIMLLAIGAFAVLNPFLIARRLQKKTIYGLTDRRVLRAGSSDESVPYERMKNAVLRTDADGHTSLLCGPRTQHLKPRQWRAEADAAFINGPDDPEAVRVILYAIPVDKELKALLKQYLNVE